MHRSSEEDYGQFNDSVVILNPIKMTNLANNKLSHHNHPQKNHLGIYDNLKLSQFIKNKQGKIISLVNLDPNSMNTFVNEEGISILQQYPTNQIAFVFVIGNKKSGKSFFCDKILNLSQIKGNQFCRSNNIGINMWSTPYEKDTLKIFLLEISGCDINSEYFKILSTYAIIVGSVFFIVDDIKQDKQAGISQFDDMLTDLSTRLSRIQQLPQPRSQLSVSQTLKYLPEYIYYLKRTDIKRQFNLQTIKYFIDQTLPDAKVASYKGTNEQLIHLSFLDNKSIDENYIKSTSKIFKQMFEVISQKRFNELILNGGIIIKILKYIENYLNNNENIDINILYQRLIEELYQSAYNYCILTYHQDMEKALNNQKPKSLEELLYLFQVNSLSILQKFQEFNLDSRMHAIYYQKLEKHIDEKEKLIMEVNKLKTQRVIMESYNPTALNNAQTYKSLLKYMKEELGHLTHGRAEALAKFNYQFYKRMEHIDYKVLEQIKRLNDDIEKEYRQYKALNQANADKSKDKLAVQELLKTQQALQKRKKQLQHAIQGQKHHNNQSIDDIKQESHKLGQIIKKNDSIIFNLQSKDNPQKKKEIFQIESRIQQTKRNSDKLQILINELKLSNPNIEGKPNQPKNNEPKKTQSPVKKQPQPQQQPLQKSKQK